jgi:hypothetical protein
LDYYNIDIFESTIVSMIGPDSTMNSLIAQLEDQLLSDGKVKSLPISTETLTAIQWSQKSLLEPYISTLPNMYINQTESVGEIKVWLSPDDYCSSEHNVCQCIGTVYYGTWSSIMED